MQTAWSGLEQKGSLTSSQSANPDFEKLVKDVLRKFILNEFLNSEEINHLFSTNELNGLQEIWVTELWIIWGSKLSPFTQEETDEDLVRWNVHLSAISKQAEHFVLSEQALINNFTKLCQAYESGNRLLINFLNEREGECPDLKEVQDELHIRRFHLSGHFSVLEEAKLATADQFFGERGEKLQELCQKLKDLKEDELKQMTLDVVLSKASEDPKLVILRREIDDLARLYTGLSNKGRDRILLRKIWEKAEEVVRALYEALN